MRSRGQWKVLLEEFNNSGLTKTAFCEKHRIVTSARYPSQYTSSLLVAISHKKSGYPCANPGRILPLLIGKGVLVGISKHRLDSVAC